ncbi:MAG: hypothetical protein FJW23_14765 [Acidimicrobiia bacterium]|nr:hypothetical protein [Acidimicrobiia bacterium]
MTAENQDPGAVTSRPPLLGLGVVTLLSLMLCLAFGQGFVATDDLGYADLATSLQHGWSDPLVTGGHRAGRIGLVFPLAVMFSVAGSNPLTLSLLPFFCTVFTAPMVAWLGTRVWGRRTGLLAGLLYPLVPITLTIGRTLVPEPIVSFELCAAAAFGMLGADPRRGRHRLALLLAGLCVGLAYLTTEAGAVMIGVLALFLVVSRQPLNHVGILLAGFLSVVVIELVYHQVIDGSALHRFSNVQAYAGHGQVVSANIDLPYRLVRAYPAMFVYPSLSLGVWGPLMIAGAIYGVSRWRHNLMFLSWAGAILLFYNFMSASLSQYVALPVSPRLIVPALPPLVILLAKLLTDGWAWLGRRRPAARVALRVGMAACLTGACAVAVVCAYLDARCRLTLVLARNATLATEFLNAYPAVSVISDPLSVRVIRFTRPRAARDSFLSFDQLARMDGVGPIRNPSRATFVVLNGPSLNARLLMGAGAPGIELTAAARTALDRLGVQATPPIFIGRQPRDPLLTTLLARPLIRSLIGPDAVRLLNMLWVSDPALSELRVVPIL